MHSEDICMVAKNGSTAESGHKFNPNKWNIEHAPQLTYPRNKMYNPAAWARHTTGMADWVKRDCPELGRAIQSTRGTQYP